MKREEILSYVDHTQLAQTAGWDSIRNLCEEAMSSQTASVCIPPSYVKPVKEYVETEYNLEHCEGIVINGETLS